MPVEKKTRKYRNQESDSPRNSQFLDDRTSQKILKIVRVQQQEEEEQRQSSFSCETGRDPVLGYASSDDDGKEEIEEKDDLENYNALLQIQLDPEQVFPLLTIKRSLSWTSLCIYNPVCFQKL